MEPEAAATEPVHTPSSAPSRRAGWGIWIALAKIGGKLLAVLGKLAKTLKVAKVALAGASVWAYASIWSWQFALVVVGSISFHEYGHVRAMHACGMKTKGFYLIPFVGGAAVPDEQFRSETDLAYVAIMGPIYGFALTAVAALVHLATGAPVFAAIAGWVALVNLFNLLPVNPLDGGRILRTIAFSIDSVLGILALASGMVASVVLAWITHFSIFVFLAVIGGIDLVVDARKRDRMPRMSGESIAVTGFMYVALIGALWYLMHVMSAEPGAALALQALKG